MVDKMPADWFDTNPTAAEHAEIKQAMIQRFATKPMDAKKPDDIRPVVLDVIDILTADQPYWEEAKRKDLRLESQRFRAVSDKVRGAYNKREKIEKEIKDFKEKQVAELLALEKAAAKANADPEPDAVPQLVPIEGSVKKET